MTDSPARAFLVDVLRGFYEPRSPFNAWQFGDDNILLRPEESQDFAGPWSSSLTPYVRFLMEFGTGQFSENIKFLPGFENEVWTEFIQKKSSQTGFTLAVLVLICFYVAVVRRNVIYSIDSEKEARRISKNRLQPMLRDCAATRARMTGDPDDLANLTLVLLGVIIYMLGGHSEGGMANKSGSLGIVDEADVHPRPDPTMPHNVDLIRDRLKASGGGRLIVLSKPSTESHITHREWKTGTRHQCFVPCPHCGHFQPLVWERVRFGHCKEDGEYDLKRVLKETFYECEGCRQPIEEKHKPGMLDRHEWWQTNPAPEPGKISAEISDLYSPFEKSSWGVLACEWIAALKDPGKFIRFWQSRLGRAWRMQQSERTADDIKALCADYRKGRIPKWIRPVLGVVASDTQDDLLKYARGVIDELGDLYWIDWGATFSFGELERLRAEPIPCEDGSEFVCQVGVIDEGGHRVDEVRRFCSKHPGVWWPTKGRGGFQIRGLVWETEGEIDGGKIPIYHFNDDGIKKLFYIQRIGKARETRDFDAGKRTRPDQQRIPTMFLPCEEDLDSALIDELVSEKLTKEKGKYGFVEEKWKKDPNLPNDFGDAGKNLLVPWVVLEPYIREALAKQKEEEEKAAAPA